MPAKIRKSNEVQIVTMTPKEAATLLKANTNNRRVKEKQVNILARAIEAGDWVLNGDAIRVSADGQLLDGQHRLAAIVKANKAVPTVLFTGAIQDDQMTMDIGTARTFSDVLQMKQVPHATIVAAATRLYAAWENSHDFSLNRAQASFSHKELHRVLEANQGIVEAAQVGRDVYTGCKIPQSVLATANYLFHDIDPHDSLFFFDRLHDGANLKTTDHTAPILKLRNFGLQRKPFERTPQNVMFGTMIKAWNKFREGDSTGTVVWRSGGANPEPFPQPR